MCKKKQTKQKFSLVRVVPCKSEKVLTKVSTQPSREKIREACNLNSMNALPPNNNLHF